MIPSRDSSSSSGRRPVMGSVRVRAWQAAYRGQMPDGYLDGLRAEDRAEGWARGLAGDRSAAPVLVAERDGCERDWCASADLLELPHAVLGDELVVLDALGEVIEIARIIRIVAGQFR